jgi:hypothetical protein
MSYFKDDAAEDVPKAVREWDDFGRGVRMRMFASGATEPAEMIELPDNPFLMYKFADMKSPGQSEMPVLCVPDATVSRKPAAALRRPAAALKRPAAAMEPADAGEHPSAATVAMEPAGAGEHPKLHAFQVTSTVTSMPVRSYTACKCGNPDPCRCFEFLVS